MSTIQERILELKNKHNALILAHYYQPGDVQDIADIVGDSYALAKKSAETDADIIVFCGVRFMAESAKILNPDRIVILPAADAGCPMADMATAKNVRDLKRKYPSAAIVSYVNTSAEVKAESDVCCTSSNAVNIVNNIKAGQIIFLPDQNLGSYVAVRCPSKEVLLYDGYCFVHDQLTREEIKTAKEAHPNAQVLIHPECRRDVIRMADFTGSTSQIIAYATRSDCKEFIIATEEGILHPLKKENPDKSFYMASPRLTCADMKKNTLQDVLSAFEAIEAGAPKNVIDLDPAIIGRARQSLNRMLEIGG